MNKLIFGTAGIPLSTHPRKTENGISRVKELGLGAMELEFVRSINITKEKAPAVKSVAESSDVVLTCHAPYYVNLNSEEKDKLVASKERVLNSARIANLCGAYSVVFHAAFYQKKGKDETYAFVKKQIQEMVDVLRSEKNDIWIRPETTGKGSQFGDLNEILQLSSEIKNVMPCIDFSHLHARSAGKMNSYKEFCAILDSVEKFLGKTGLHNMHIHVSGINYSDKGERNHLVLSESDMNYKELMKALKEYECKGILISESPNIEEDALLMKNVYDSA